MLQIIAHKPVSLLHFIKEFRPFFSKPALASFSIYLSGLFLELKRTNINTITAKTPSAAYQNIQYFLSEAKWNPDDINNHRLRLLQDSINTRVTKRGVLVIDDSSCKKWGMSTQGAAKQYCSTEKGLTNCNVVVFTAYADKTKRYPINLKPYIPKNDPLCKEHEVMFKSKLDLAKDLVEDAISKDIPFSAVVFDNWYFSNDFVSFLSDLNLNWITEAEKDRLISFKGKWALTRR